MPRVRRSRTTGACRAGRPDHGRRLIRRSGHVACRLRAGEASAPMEKFAFLQRRRAPMQSDVDQIFTGDSEMASRISQLDWSKTLLGPVDQWPPSLRASVSICLDCAFPIVIWWGAELAILYNDEYRAMLGPTKHPGALGERGAAVWAEIWDVVGPMLERVRTTG